MSEVKEKLSREAEETNGKIGIFVTLRPFIQLKSNATNRGLENEEITSLLLRNLELHCGKYCYSLSVLITSNQNAIGISTYLSTVRQQIK